MVNQPRVKLLAALSCLLYCLLHAALVQAQPATFGAANAPAEDPRP